MMRQRGINLLHYYVKSRFSHDAPKNLIFDAFLVEKQVFS